MARCAVPARAKPSAAEERFSTKTKEAHAFVPPAAARARTSQRDVPTTEHRFEEPSSIQIDIKKRRLVFNSETSVLCSLLLNRISR